MEVKYSFIIPHRNSPNLLVRCINSIPQRKDVEIVVVDDNSEASLKPIVERKDVLVVNINKNESKGAGRARNYGIKYAKGEWLFFIDADDFLPESILEKLDEECDSGYDVIYHNAVAVDSETLQPVEKLLRFEHKIISNYLNKKTDIDEVKYRLHAPWWKVIRRAFLIRNNIQFEEISKGNDIFFTYQIGYFAHKIKFVNTPMYVYTYNRQGISLSKKDSNVCITMVVNKLKIKEFYKYIGHPEWKIHFYRLWFSILKNEGFFVFGVTCFKYFKNIELICKEKRRYVDSLLLHN